MEYLRGYGKKRKGDDSYDAENQNGVDGHLYYNICVPNNTTGPMPVFFRETRSTPLLRNPSLYHASVIRFKFNASLIPIFHWPYTGTPPQADNTQQWVTLSAGGHPYQAFLLYTPQQVTTIPSIFSYQHYIDIINTALATATTALNAGEGGTTYKAPFLVYNGDSTAPIALLASNDWVTGGGAALGITFSYSIYSKFFNFQATCPLAGGSPYTLLVKNNGNNLRTAATNGQIYPLDGTAAYDGLQMNQEFNSLSLWNNVRSIQFLSSVAVRPESVPSQIPSSNTSDNSVGILTDFEPSFNDGTQARSDYSYNPTAEFRRLDLMDTSSMMSFDLQVQWTDNNGISYPLCIPPGTSLTCKILFERKRS